MLCYVQIENSNLVTILTLISIMGINIYRSIEHKWVKVCKKRRNYLLDKGRKLKTKISFRRRFKSLLNVS